MEIKLSEENLKKLEELKLRYPDKQSLVLPVLWMIQEQYGWISLEAMNYTATLLDISQEHIIGVVRFYTMYNKEPVGKNHIQVCTNVSCMLKGGYEILEHIEKRLGIKAGETSKNMDFTISEVECLGSCGTAPMLQLNDDYMENLSTKDVDELLDKLSKKK